MNRSAGSEVSTLQTCWECSVSLSRHAGSAMSHSTDLLGVQCLTLKTCWECSVSPYRLAGSAVSHAPDLLRVRCLTLQTCLECAALDPDLLAVKLLQFFLKFVPSIS
ncbi:unnamed protein product [Arctogadus glacialis]